MTKGASIAQQMWPLIVAVEVAAVATAIRGVPALCLGAEIAVAVDELQKWNVEKSSCHSRATDTEKIELSDSECGETIF